MFHRRPDAFEAQATWLHLSQLRRLSSKLRHEIVGHHRCVEFLLEHLHGLGADVFSVHRDLQVANIELDIIAAIIEFRRCEAF